MLLRKLGLSLAAVLLAFMLVELLVRLSLGRPQTVSIHSDADAAARLREENRQPTELDLNKRVGGLYVMTPAGKRLRANTVAVIKDHSLSRRDITIRTNSLGYRNPEVGPKSGRRILFLGDSITFGDYLEEDDTFVRQVETLTQDRSPPWETINAGVGAIGLKNELAILLETGLQTDPDVVVLGFYLNDVQDSPGVEVLEVPPLLRWSAALQHLAVALPVLLSAADRSVDKEVLRGWLDAVKVEYPAAEGNPLTDPEAFHGLIHRWFGDWGSSFSAAAWETMTPLFDQFVELADRHSFQLVVICFPVREQVEAEALHDYPQRRLRLILAERQVPLLDLLPLLRKQHRAGEEPLFYDQCHHTPAGNRWIAQWVMKFLLQAADT
jgi:hypothetical protein